VIIDADGHIEETILGRKALELSGERLRARVGR
jgi:hypothetical protein